MDIYTYLDYRKFLKEYYEESKKKYSYFSYRYMGQKFGIDPGYLVKVIQGKWHISEKSIPAIAKLCKFTSKEIEYFETLVQFGKAKTPSEAKRFFEALLAYRNVTLTSMTAMEYEFYRKWYYSAVRAVLGYYSFDGDFALLGQQLSPQITEKQARESIELLLRLSLIEEDEDGNYHVTKSLITSGEEWKSVAIHEHQKEMINLASTSLDRIKKDNRDVSTLTMALPKEIIPVIKDKTKEFRNTIIKIVNDCENADSIYQLNIQLFPLTSDEEEC